ncbi:MAG TPA: hypothetical protein VHC70_09605 [Phycisphaerales bacterium]|jgi:hypothetical protein|nr:hypothetical protein [Phycisphaerales bacterium]
MMRFANVAALACILAALAACEQKPASTTSRTPAPGAGSSAPLPSGLFLAAAPADSKDVKDAKASAKQGEKIVLTGRIGGSEEPFVDGRAMFTLVDLRLKYCGQDDKDDHCKTPWDYCCEPADALAANSATIQVVGADGKPLRTSLNGVQGLKPLAKVTVTGTVADVAQGNLIVRAEGIHVLP